MKSPRRNLYIVACLWSIELLFAISNLSAATYYVATNGSDGNPGSQASPWLTINYAASQVTAGDIVRVQAGTYDEQASITSSGTSGNWITFVGDNHPVCRGFNITDASYIRIIGFEITHESLAYYRGVSLFNTCSHIDILDNYIHDVSRQAVAATSATVLASYIKIRGNTIYYTSHVPASDPNANGDGRFATAIVGCPVKDDHWVIEYNTVQKSLDFCDVYGTNIIIRNNFMHDYKDAYYTNTPATAYHSDMFQPGSDGGMVAGTRNHIYERNLCGDSTENNSHFTQLNDTLNAGDTNIMIRGNVGYNFGGAAISVYSMDHVVEYNNTFYSCQNLNPKYPVVSWNKQSTSTDYPVNSLGANTILAFSANYVVDGFYVVSGATAELVNNIGYLSGTDSSYVSMSNPLFVDANSLNFRLQAGSPAIASGINVVWITSNSGSGTSFNVNDAQLLCDGWGMVDGDTVTIGGTTTHVTSITANSVTVADSVTWTKNMAVYWGKYSVVDIGALPYGSKALTSARLYQTGNNYSVDTTGDARGVWYYVDGIPTTWVSKPPFTATITNGIVTAKAYALYAQMNPVVVAINTHSTLPLPPTTLTVVTNAP